MVANGTKLVRIYADIAEQQDAALEELARINGRTKKGQLEYLIREATATQAANEPQTKSAKKGRK